MTFCSIYKITNLIDGKFYIGQTWNTLQNRFSQHCNSRNHCVKLYRAIKKYGKNNFNIELVILTHTQEIANYWEIYFIQNFDAVKIGYNLQLGGSAGKHSEESKIKMRKPKSEATKSKMRKPKSEEAKIAMRKPKSEIAKSNMSKAVQARKIDISKSLRGKNHSIEKSIFQSRKGKKISEQHKLNMKKPKLTSDIVEMIRLDVTNENFTFGELANKYQVSISTIGRIANNKTHKRIC